jgi:hypothetical protein
VSDRDDSHEEGKFKLVRVFLLRVQRISRSLVQAEHVGPFAYLRSSNQSVLKTGGTMTGRGYLGGNTP